MEKIFVMNLGTTSFKFKFYAFEGDGAHAQLAFDTLCDNILSYIGMYAAYLNGLDAPCHRLAVKDR